MKITHENKNYLIYISKYLGVALIAGSVVHIGTLDNGTERYIILMIIGMLLMMFGNISEAKQIGTKINANFLLVITSLSIATGFLSGGVQHYLDNPVYAGYLLAIGLLVTYVAFFLKDKVVLKTRDILIVFIVSLSILFLSNTVLHNYAETINKSEVGNHHTE